jgi:uncharacterized protein
MVSNAQILVAIADTHVPDRTPMLSASLLAAIEAVNPDLIVHAGDIAVQRVLTQLQMIAPLIAVRGNRDFAFLKTLPLTRQFEFGPVSIGLAHGHGGLKRYLIDKVKYVVTGYSFERVRAYLDQAFPSARIVIFGHTHRPENRWIDGHLYFNPGAAYPYSLNSFRSEFGILRIGPDGQINSEIVIL